MNRDSHLTLPPAPNLIGAIRSGFDAVAHHLILILFPIALDLILWLGPRIKLTGLINSTTEQLVLISTTQDPSLKELVTPVQESWAILAEMFNMLVFLRSYPVGITSLISTFPIDTSPLGIWQSWEIASAGGVFLAFVLISLVGLALGTFYFLGISQAAVIGDISWREVFSTWPWATLQIIFLALLWTVVLLVITIPGSFILSLVMLSGAAYGLCAILIFAGVFFWLIIPLVFSPHGIIQYQMSFLESVKTSVNLTRRSLPSTVLFVMGAFLLSKGLDLLWRIDDETSWILLVGILGHAFVTTGLLASSFVYYRDALRWVREMVKLRELKTI
jgi:hypothetical protein